MTEKSNQNKIKKLEDQFFRFAGNERKQANIYQRILTIKNTETR